MSSFGMSDVDEEEMSGVAVGKAKKFGDKIEIQTKIFDNLCMRAEKITTALLLLFGT